MIDARRIDPRKDAAVIFDPMEDRGTVVFGWAVQSGVPIEMGRQDGPSCVIVDRVQLQTLAAGWFGSGTSQGITVVNELVRIPPEGHLYVLVMSGLEARVETFKVPPSASSHYIAAFRSLLLESFSPKGPGTADAAEV